MVSIRRIASRIRSGVKKTISRVKARVSRSTPKVTSTIRKLPAKRLPSKITRDVAPKSSFTFTGFGSPRSRDLGGGGGGSRTIQPVTNFIQAETLEPIAEATRQRRERGTARTIARQFGTFRTQTVGERRVERSGRRRSASGKLRGRIR